MVCLIVGTGDRVTVPTADIIRAWILCTRGFYSFRNRNFIFRVDFWPPCITTPRAFGLSIPTENMVDFFFLIPFSTKIQTVIAVFFFFFYNAQNRRDNKIINTVKSEYRSFRAVKTTIVTTRVSRRVQSRD